MCFFFQELCDLLGEDSDLTSTEVEGNQSDS